MAVSGLVYPTYFDPDLLKTCPSYDGAFLGEGAFGSVLKAFMGDRNQTVAVKLIQGESNNFKNFQKEVTKLSAVLDCGNIITPLGWFTYAGWAGIVMEYAECGNLYELLHTRDVILPLCLKSRILYEIVNAVNHLHRLGNDQRLLHLDLKPQNILFDADLHVKICDLGGSVWSNFTEDFTRSTEGFVDSDEQANVCSLAYCAPERLRHSNIRPTSKVDIFSIG
uniref:Protein kinase domain-containing protein n=1 Tax=Ciona savignyi TaxID=51511 RepID=H2YEC5_CIOSA